MKTIWKILILAGLILVLVGLGLGFFRGFFTGQIVLNGYHTVAVCNDSGFCQDYEVSCEGGRVVYMRAVEGASVWHDEGWIDFRSEAERRLC